MTFKKRAVPCAVRREVVRRYGAELGNRIDVKCHYCDFVGAVVWDDRCRYWPGICNLEFDHVTPEFLGGPNTAANLVLACRRCNRSKGHKAPVTAEAVTV